MKTYILHARSTKDGKIRVEVQVDMPNTDYEVVVVVHAIKEQKSDNLLNESTDKDDK